MPPVTITVPDVSVAVSTSGYIKIDFLLPNGIFIPMDVEFYTSFETIKQLLWKEAEKYPLFKLLKNKEVYSFICISQHGEREEILDELQCLKDVNPSGLFLQLTEKKGDERHKTLVRRINQLIGRGHYEFDKIINKEVKHFQQNTLKFCEKLVADRKKHMTWKDKLLSTGPSRVRSDCQLPPELEAKLQDGLILVAVYISELQEGVKFVEEMGSVDEDALTRHSKNKLLNSKRRL